ncbi:MAG: restriction endonuclease subunit S, partial [Polaribacter sp.]
MNNFVKISDLFNLNYGNSLELINLEKCKSTDYNSIPFVSRTEKNNGVSAYVYELIDIEPNPKHVLTVALGGSVLSTFYQPKEFYTGFHVLVLSPKNTMSVEEMLFYATCISSNKYKYSYGRQANRTLKDLLIPKSAPVKLLKTLSDFKINLEQNLKQKPILNKKINLGINNWKLFSLIDLFTITGSKTTPKQELQEIGKGIFPNVTTQATNNGIDSFYDIYTEDDNVLTIDSAVIGYCAFQPIRFSASDHVEKLIPKFKMNKYVAMFFVTILNMSPLRKVFNKKALKKKFF